MLEMTIQDLEIVQKTLKEAGLEYQLELQAGKIIVMGPSDIVSSEIGAELIRVLGNWVKPRRLGRIFDSSGGFILPNSDLTAPDVAFVRASRLRQSPRYFAQLVPDLVVEIKSQSDRIKPLVDKIKLFLSLGAEVGVLIDPDQKTVIVYRSSTKPIIYNNSDSLTIPELFPGWELPVTQLWPLEFDNEEDEIDY